MNRSNANQGASLAIVTMTERWMAAVASDAAPGATDGELDAAAAALGIELPDDYRAVMRHANGGESEFGQSWIVLQRLDDVVARNATFREAEFPPGFTFFGSDGAGQGYAWDSRPERRSNYVVVPFIVPEPEAAIPGGDTFEEFLGALYVGLPLNRST